MCAHIFYMTNNQLIAATWANLLILFCGFTVHYDTSLYLPFQSYEPLKKMEKAHREKR